MLAFSVTELVYQIKAFVLSFWMIWVKGFNQSTKNPIKYLENAQKWIAP